MNILSKLFLVKNMLKSNEIRGELPTTKEVYKRTIDMAWPSALEAVLVAMISAFDMIMVGSLGKEAISAVGICNQPKYICLAPILAINTAAVVLVARRKGEEKQKDANDFLKVSIIWSIIVSLLMCTTSYVFAKPMLLFSGAQADYIDQAVTYFRIVLIGLVPYSVGLTMSSAQRGAGNTRISMVTNLTANIVNIIFNALLINGLLGFPRLGVKGAAIATTIGNIVSFFIALFSLTFGNHYLHLTKTKIEHFIEKCKNFYSIFISSFGEQIILRFGFFTYAKVVANLGTTAFAAHQVVCNIMTITFSFGDGLQVANTSLVGQSLGAKRDDLAKIYSRVTQTIGICTAIILAVLISRFSNLICTVFTNDSEVIQLAYMPMQILGILCLFQIPQVITVGALRGAGDVKFVALMMFICVGLIRPGVSYLLVYPFNMGLIGAWIGCFIDQFSRFVYSIIRFRRGKWTEIKV